MSIQQGFAVHPDLDVKDAIEFAASRGFDFVELDMEYTVARRRVDPAVVDRTAEQYGIDLLVHLPYRLDTASPHEHVREGACRELEAAIDTAIEFGAKKGVFHANSFAQTDTWENALLREQLYKSINRITAYAQERDFEACVENLKEPFFDVGDFPDLFEQTGAVGCLDTGHAYVSGWDTTRQATLLREYPDRISHLHLNDTRRENDDEHLPVGLGVLEFGPLVDALEETDQTYTCTHEVYSLGTEYCGYGKDVFQKLRRGESDDRDR